MIIYAHDPADGFMVRWAGRIDAGAWIVETADSTAAGYHPARAGIQFESESGIVSIEAALPVNDSLTKAQLQDIAAQLGLSTSGLKAEILQRILDEIEP